MIITQGRDAPNQEVLRSVRGRPFSFLVIAILVWAGLAAVISLLVLLPWLWWNGGSLEVVIPRHYIRAEGGAAYSVVVWHVIRQPVPLPGEEPTSFFFQIMSDSAGRPDSTLELYEDDKPLGPAHAESQDIEESGQGRFSHLSRRLIFSASDNSDPGTNRRRYTIRGFSKPRFEAIPIAVFLAAWLAAAATVLYVARSWRLVAEFIHGAGADSAPALFTFFIITAFVVYTIAFAALQRRFALQYMSGLGISSALFLLVSRKSVVLRGWMAWLTAFLIYAAGSVALLHASLTSYKTVLDLLLSVLLGIIVFSAIRRGLEVEGSFPAIFISAISPFFGLAMFMRNLGFDLKGVLANVHSLRFLPWQNTTWAQKYEETWLLVFTWWVVAAAVPYTGRRVAATGIVLTFSGLAVFSGYSYTAKGVFVAGIAVFLASLLTPQTIKFILVCTVAVLLLMPIFVGYVWDYYVHHPAIVDAEHGIGKHLVRRLVAWEYARERIKEHPWLGWGIGASKSLPGTKGRAEEFLEGGSELPQFLAELRAYPGGHPHNLALLIWLETGALGAVLAAGLLLTIFRSLAFIQERTRRSALLALVASLLLVLGFNYPAWDPTIVMLIMMTASLAGALGVAPLAESRSDVAPQDEEPGACRDFR